ncbi:acyl-CoA dehydrogenase family protein [Thalassiella azotivora]
MSATPTEFPRTPRRAPGADSQRAHLLAMLTAGQLDLPHPLAGNAWERWRRLADWGADDLVLARLAEGHTDAVAVLTEAGVAVPGGRLLAVWASASEGTGLDGTPVDGGVRLDGTLRFASGARVVDTALVTLQTPAGRRLALLDVHQDGVTAVEGTWPAVGMDDSDSLDVTVAGVVVDEAGLVGPPGFYSDRPGLAVGGMGVAAVWWGGARAVADHVTRALAARAAAGHPPTPHQLAHLGGIRSAVARGEAVLRDAAGAVDADPRDRHRPLALHVRHVVEQVVEEVLRRAGRCTGATPLCRDAGYARLVADLTVFVRQQHAEGDLERLGAAALDGWTT